MYSPASIFLSRDRKSTRLNSSHPSISYAVFCLKKKKCNADFFDLERIYALTSALESCLMSPSYSPSERNSDYFDLQRIYALYFFINDTATTEIYTLSLHDALPIWQRVRDQRAYQGPGNAGVAVRKVVDVLAGVDLLEPRSEEHTSELQSPVHLVCRLLLEKKKM